MLSRVLPWGETPCCDLDEETTLTPGRASGHWHPEIQWGGLLALGSARLELETWKTCGFFFPYVKVHYPVVALGWTPASTPAQP